MRIILATLLAVGTAAAPAQDTTVKLGTLAPEGSPWHEIIRDMADSWKKASGGKVGFRIFAGGAIGDEPDMVRKMRINQLQAAALTGVGLAEIAPEILGVQLPLLVRTYEELDVVMARLAPRFEKVLHDKGYTVLNWGDAGWIHFFGTKPIVSMADLRSMKLFVWAGSALEIEVWKDAGIQAVPLQATDILPSLQSGLINAYSTTPLASLSFQWFGLAKHMTGMRWGPLIGATVVTNKAWAKIPDAQKPALLEEARRSGERLKTETRKLGDKAVEIMKERGLVVHDVPPEAMAEWERVAAAAWPKVRSVPPDLLAEIRRILADHRAQSR